MSDEVLDEVTVRTIEDDMGLNQEPGVNGLDDDILSTPEIAVPPAEPEAHRGEIVSVELNVAESGSTSFRINLRSTDTGKEDTKDVWLPRGFVENIHVDPNELPDEEGNRQRMSYRIGISNSDKNAEIQGLRLLAANSGRKYTGAKPDTIEEFIQAHNELLSGMEVVYTKRPEKSKPGEDNRFAGRLRVGAIMDPNEAMKPKSLKKYHKMWEV